MAPMEHFGGMSAAARGMHADLGIGSTVGRAHLARSMEMAMAVLLSLGMYNSLELLVIILMTFNSRSGLYFWTMVAASLGCGFFGLGFLVNNFQLAGHHYIIPALLTLTGWTIMVTGQSLVLYSRLHLLYQDDRKLKLVRNLIIFNAVCLHIPTWVVTVAADRANPGPFPGIYSIVERVQVTVFFLQELLLSGMYVVKAFGFLQHMASTDAKGSPLNSVKMRRDRAARGMFTHLIVVNALIILMDVTILVLEYQGLFLLQNSHKAFVYSLKLKAEVSILSRLAHFVKNGQQQMQSSFLHPAEGATHEDGFVGALGAPDKDERGPSTRLPGWSRGKRRAMVLGAPESDRLSPTAQSAVSRATQHERQYPESGRSKIEVNSETAEEDDHNAGIATTPRVVLGQSGWLVLPPAMSTASQQPDPASAGLRDKSSFEIPRPPESSL